MDQKVTALYILKRTRAAVVAYEIGWECWNCTKRLETFGKNLEELYERDT